MKKFLIILLLFIFFSKTGNPQSLPDDKSIIVEMFASNIFNVDEDLNGVYERPLGGSVS